MSQVKRYTGYSTVQRTTVYIPATPAVSPSSWGTDNTQVGLDVPGTPRIAPFGAVFTRVLTAPGTFVFAGVRVKLAPTYTTPPPLLEIWTVNDLGTWQKETIASVNAQEIDMSITTNPFGGVASAQLRIFDLLLKTPRVDLEKVWITVNPNGGVPSLDFRAIHLYEMAVNTDTADPFDPNTGSPPLVSMRPRGSTKADIIGGKFANLSYTVDLTPLQSDDELASENGSWGLWDLPTCVALDFADELGNDILLIAIGGTVFILDWELYRDEFAWDTWSPLYTMVESVPIPSVPDERYSRVRPDASTSDPYSPEYVKRFRTLLFELDQAPVDEGTRFRLTVQETDQPATARVGTFVTRRRNRAQVAVSGLSFTWKLEHAANELFRPLWWEAQYDIKGPQIRASPPFVLP